jgi:anti-anti-sigma factor
LESAGQGRWLGGDFLPAPSSIQDKKIMLNRYTRHEILSEKAMESVMLTIDVEKAGDVAVVHCGGRLVRGAEVATLRSAVVSEKTTRIVVLDLSQLEFIDGGGLNALVSLHHWTRNHGIQLKLVNPSHFVNEMLTRTRLNRVFDISSLHDALRVLAGAECHHSRYAAGFMSLPQALAAK